jgi:hypothetical protein
MPVPKQPKTVGDYPTRVIRARGIVKERAQLVTGL